tara:strand:+ start:406 stop:645 length:240 start_codon:yes stop_codon:yes gene_type:complete
MVTNQLYFIHMRLKDYKELHNLSYAELAEKLGIENSMTIYRYCTLARFPKPDMVHKIETVTKLAVTAQDFQNHYQELHG